MITVIITILLLLVKITMNDGKNTFSTQILLRFFHCQVKLFDGPMAPVPSFAGECGVKWIASSSGNATAALKPQSIKAGENDGEDVFQRSKCGVLSGKLGICSPIS